MEHTVEQRMNVKFCAKLQKSQIGQMPVIELENEECSQTEKPWVLKSKMKTVLMYFFDIMDIIHSKFIPKGPAVNQIFCVVVLERFIDTLRHKQGEPWRDPSLILHHDNMLTLCSECRSF
jgi:hypothetical protein